MPLTVQRLLVQRRAQAGLLLIALLVAGALLAPIVSPYDPIAQLDLEQRQLLAPSPAHPFGTDLLSRDLLSRVLFGARISLAIAFLSVTVSIVVGTLVGLVAGFAGGALDTLAMRAVDTALAIPRIFLLLVILGLWGAVGVPVLIVILGLTNWFDTSRLVRAEVLSLKQREFVLATRALGVGPTRTLFGHILPNVAAPITVSAALGIGQIVLVEAGLSFLGIGVRKPTPSWGLMIAESQDLMVSAWWTVAFPGLAIVITVIAFSLLGDALQAALDPRTR